MRRFLGASSSKVRPGGCALVVLVPTTDEGTMTLVAVQLETSFLVPTTSVLVPPNTTQVRMDSQVPLLIHEVLPGEIMALIFEEHAKLEWFAPAIDGRVCRLWRQITLNAPRAWTYIEISWATTLRISDLLLWLDRSRTAPLHITVCDAYIPGTDTNIRRLYEPLYTRIVSLRMFENNPSFFDGQDFPCMQHLEVLQLTRECSPPPLSFGHMPKLRSLHLGTFTHTASFDGLAPLKALVLSIGKFTSLSQHSQSLVSLMLQGVDLGDAISGLMDFPSLTYLSLCYMSDLKPHINAPRLVTYHEVAPEVDKSFSVPLHSLVEFGLEHFHSHPVDLTKWHNFFPNISRLSIRAPARDLVSLLNSLSIHPHLLPALQMISVGRHLAPCGGFTKKDQGTMKNLVRVRSEACHLDVTLYFETEEPMHIPLFLAEDPEYPQ